MTAAAIDTERTLTDTERARLRDAETRIQKAMDGIEAGFRDIAAALEMIHADQLYLLTHRTWDEYVSKRWGHTRSWASRIMRASRITSLLPNGDILTRESHVRAIEKFPEEIRPMILHYAALRAEQQQKPVTAARIERVGSVIEQSWRTGHVDTGNGASTPLDAALTVEDYEALERQRQRISDAGKPREYVIKAQAFPAAGERVVIAIPEQYRGKTIVISAYIESEAA